MKLINKKTGEIQEYVELIVNKPFGETKQYTSLSEFVEEWEDYTPKEPLIKDEKARKAVRAWAEANDIDTRPSEQRVEYNFAENRLTWIATCIEFNESRSLENLNDGETYTITELCGEEE